MAASSDAPIFMNDSTYDGKCETNSISVELNSLYVFSSAFIRSPHIISIRHTQNISVDIDVIVRVVSKRLKNKNETKYTYNISSSAKPLKACSSKHIISLLSICKLRNDGAPLKIFRPIVVSELCDKSLLTGHKRLTIEIKINFTLCQSSNSSKTDYSR